ncbi:KPN_02809 family neutral zinc metallopeptidase [Lacisediminihabitans changchengi]|uniref:Neutral zinc metallopeptidase n=1 Tax=Lacisediminihabitans changchengi TaxID=2787634 RepID=A0A934W5G9_9MICO|nr:neutral zinc metallopeptidase [Lacisediminihabitans changchengi]MBK4348495.1 neutral zinc metallopeptidase [Lacisediminihabitans changchengi]
MTFNDDADISKGNARSGGGRRRTGLVVGGGGGVLVTIAIIVIANLLGVDLGTDAGSDAGSQPAAGGQDLSQCTTGAQANADVGCRMKGAAASLDVYWAQEAPVLGVDYTSPDFVLFGGSTDTPCGTASGATGPFYCPSDKVIYLDTAFFTDLRDTYGATAGSLSQLYVVAHEWGHGIQDLAGRFANQSGDQEGAGSDSVRTELQADCFAGAWVGAATETTDDNGVPFLEPVTSAQVADALNAAAAIGDDRLQKLGGGAVDPDSWTHGSSAQRQRWFETGYQSGAESCDTFTPRASQL